MSNTQPPTPTPSGANSLGDPRTLELATAFLWYNLRDEEVPICLCVSANLPPAGQCSNKRDVLGESAVAVFRVCLNPVSSKGGPQGIGRAGGSLGWKQGQQSMETGDCKPMSTPTNVRCGYQCDPSQGHTEPATCQQTPAGPDRQTSSPQSPRTAHRTRACIHGNPTCPPPQDYMISLSPQPWDIWHHPGEEQRNGWEIWKTEHLP